MSCLRSGVTGNGYQIAVAGLAIAWTDMVRCFTPNFCSRLEMLVDVPEGDYEFEERAPETGQSVTISSFQEPRSSEAPHYDPAQDTTYDEPSQAAFETSPVTPDYTFEDTTTAFGNLDLNKGKEPDTGNFPTRVQDIRHVTANQ